MNKDESITIIAREKNLDVQFALRGVDKNNEYQVDAQLVKFALNEDASAPATVEKKVTIAAMGKSLEDAQFKALGLAIQLMGFNNN